MPEIVLDEAQVVAAIRKIEAARMPQHVRPNRRQAGTRRRAGYQVIHRLPGKRLCAFGDEQPGELVDTSGEIPLDCAQLVAGDWLLDREAILETSHPQPGLPHIYLVEPEPNGLAHSQPVAIHHEHKQMVAYAVPTGLCSLEEHGDLGLGQEVLSPFVLVRSVDYATFDTSPFG
jgi:hypothetical protein